jgi:nicotinamidase-related amidase
MKVHGLIIDPQLDFCWPGLSGMGVDLRSPEWQVIAPLLQQALGPSYDALVNPGALYVPGADQDMGRLAKMIDRIHHKVDDFYITLDSHRKVDQAHPLWWKDSSGRKPNPFTILASYGDKVVRMEPQADGSLVPTSDEYQTFLPSFMNAGGPTGKGSKGYLEALAEKGRYPHVVWPEHCLIGTWGHGVWPPLMKALMKWEDSFAVVNYVTKGSNMYTEHYSGVCAEVPDPKDHTTQINTQLISTLEEADIIFLAGEARSHCLANTVRDIAENFSDPKYIQKLVLLTDATSDVPGFEHLGQQFVDEMTAKGMQLSTTDEFLR